MGAGIARTSDHRLAGANVMDCCFEVLDNAENRVVRIAGSLSQANVPDLLMLCAHRTGSVVVDLTDVVSVDGIAADALCRVRDAGTTLVGASHYLQQKLERESSRRQSRDS
jgi:anti-anti-sigma regulatory factor